MYLARSEGHLSGCDTARLLLDRLAGCGQWQGAHAAGGRAAVRSRPPRRENHVAELESWGRGWLGVGFQAPYPAVIVILDTLPARQVPTWTGYAPL